MSLPQALVEAEKIPHTANDSVEIGLKTSETPAIRHGIQNDRHISAAPSTALRDSAKVRRLYRMKVLFGTMLPFLLASLDLTVVSTALPFIAQHFGKTEQQTWIVTAYTLTGTAFIPAFAQLADVFGRHATLQFSLLLMIIGSILCTAAPTWAVLILGRALQGMSAAGITSAVSVILSDKVSLAENSKNNSVVSFISGTAYCYGPIVGGYLTRANWRWCFLLSIPIAVFAVVVNLVMLRKHLIKGTHSIWRSPLSGLAVLDAIGTSLFVAAIALLILAITWGGASYPWSSATVIVPLVLGVLLLILCPSFERALEREGGFVRRHLPKQEPMIPTSIFSKRDMVWAAVVQFASGAALYSIFYYLAIYYILVQGLPPSEAGLKLLWYIAGIGAGVLGAGIGCNAFPASTFFPLLIGTISETLGIGLVAYGIHVRNTWILSGMTVLGGFGTGMRLMPVGLHVTGVWPSRRAQAVSLMKFCLPFGGTIALAIMGSTFNNKMGSIAKTFDTSSVSAFSAFSGSSSNVDVLSGLPLAEAQMIRSQAALAVKWAFISILPILILSCFACLLLGNVWIKSPFLEQSEGTQSRPRPPEESSRGVNLQTSEFAQGASFILEESYLFALLRGQKYLRSRMRAWH